MLLRTHSSIASRARSLALLGALVLAACAGGAGTTNARPVPFSDVASAATTRHDGGPALIVATNDQARARIVSLRPGLTLPNDVVVLAVLQGRQPTGGFAIRVTRIEREGDRLIVRAIFAIPLPNALVSQAQSSPVHIVSIAAADGARLREAVLLDDTGAERARSKPD